MKSLQGLWPYAQFVSTEPMVSNLFLSTTVTTIRNNISSAASAAGLDVNASYVLVGITGVRPCVAAFADFDTLASYLDQSKASASSGIGATPVHFSPFYWVRVYWWPDGISPRRYFLTSSSTSQLQLKENRQELSCYGS